MTRTILAALLTFSLAVPAAANSSQLILSVQRELDQLGFSEVDASTLTSAQLSAIHYATTRKRESGRRAKVKSILGNSYSLTGQLR